LGTRETANEAVEVTGSNEGDSAPKLPLHTEGTPLEVNRALWVGRRAELDALLSHFQQWGAKQAVIAGPRGSGRTALAFMFREESVSLFPQGWRSVHATPFADMVPDFFGEVRVNSPRRSLLFIDDFEVGSEAFRSVLWSYLAQNPNVSLLLSTQGEVPSEMRKPLVITLGGLTQAEFLELLQRRLSFTRTDEAQARRLFSMVAGSPLFGDLAGRTVRDHLLTLSQFVEGLQPFRRSGILGPNGQALTDLPDSFRLVVVDANQALLEHIRANPGQLYSLQPRRFEELVAHILRERGYEVTLTPSSKDGGFDMSAARRDDLGSFLYLVECKRYAPQHKVGVSIVRSLHGVVQQQKANAGIIVTTSFFTRGAREFQEEVPHQLQLQDYLALQKWLGVI
jgi:restriction system protein